MKMAIELTEVTPTIKRIPIFKLPRKEFSDNGMTVIMRSVGATRAMGASVITGLSASSGRVSSFMISFITSAKGCKSPNGPFLLGPLLTWNLPRVRLSNHV